MKMKPARAYVLVLVTAPDLPTARKLARTALEARLVACVSLLPGLESHYWWKGRLERAGEVLLLLKTRKALLEALERFVVQRHPYETPEVLAVSLDRGSGRYLAWLSDCTSGKARTALPLRNNA